MTRAIKLLGIGLALFLGTTCSLLPANITWTGAAGGSNVTTPDSGLSVPRF